MARNLVSSFPCSPVLHGVPATRERRQLIDSTTLGTGIPPLSERYALGSDPRLQPTSLQSQDDRELAIEVLRLDEIHPFIHGNKGFKLRRNLAAAAAEGHSTLLSFGGAYSNHLYALAAAGKEFGFRTIGLVRGELFIDSNPVMGFAHAQGMELVALSRLEYRHRAESAFIESLCSRFGEHYLIPEGGANLHGVLGCADMAQQLVSYGVGVDDLIILAVGTGTTVAGLTFGLTSIMGNSAPAVLGVNVVRAEAAIENEVRRWLEILAETEAAPLARFNYSLNGDFHHGGYAKTSPELMEFIETFNARTKIPLEPVYTGKLMFALQRLWLEGELDQYRRVIAIHSGGITEENQNSLYKTKR